MPRSTNGVSNLEDLFTETFTTTFNTSIIDLADGALSAAPGVGWDDSIGFYRNGNQFTAYAGANEYFSFGETDNLSHLPLVSAHQGGSSQFMILDENDDPGITMYMDDDADLGVLNEAQIKAPGFLAIKQQGCAMFPGTTEDINYVWWSGDPSSPDFCAQLNKDGLQIGPNTLTGIRSESNWELDLFTHDVTRLKITETSLEPQVPILAPDGSAANPSYSNQGDANTGFYFPAADQQGWSTNGIERLLLTTTGYSSTVPIIHAAGTAALPSLTTDGDLNTGFYFPAADQVGVSTGGTERLLLTTTGYSSTVPRINAAGTVGAPSITATGDLNTGVYFPAADTLAVATGGTQCLKVSSAGVDLINGLQVNGGTNFNVLSLSKVWSPTIVNGTNINASTLISAYYMQFGELVVCALNLNIDVTATNTDSELSITIPVAYTGANTRLTAWGNGLRVGTTTFTANYGFVTSVVASTTTVVFRLRSTTVTDGVGEDYNIGFSYYVTQ